jgi:hypothetical protein
VRACADQRRRVVAHLRTPIVELRVIQPTSRCILIRAISLVTFFLKESDKKIESFFRIRAMDLGE